MDHHEQEMREALASPIRAGIIDLLPSDLRVVEGLERAFPFSGSKIAWKAVQGHLSATQAQPGHEEFCRFFDARRSELGGNQTAFYVNDNLMDCAARASLFTFQRHLDTILAMPAHHYFVGENLNWCLAYTKEGDIDFGWSPTISQ